MRYAVRTLGRAVAWCSLSIKVGTRDEEGFPEGTAHFLEHAIFRGTEKYSADEINSCLESGGGELNAFTTKEEIVLHATVLIEDLGKAIDLLLELAAHPTFPEKGVKTEKGVVLDEIASYKDSPADDIYDVFEQRLFSPHPLSRLILGTEESVSGITTTHLRDFRSRFFVPERMALAVVSPYDEDTMKALVEECVAKYFPQQNAQTPSLQMKEEYPSAQNIFHVDEAKDLSEVNCVVGGPAPSLCSTKYRLATSLLCNMLGGPASNSILGSRLREKNGWVYNVDCTYTPYSDGGVAAVQFGCDEYNAPKCLAALKGEFLKITDSPISGQELEKARRQMLGQHAIGMEFGENVCISMGKNLLYYGNIPSDESLIEQMRSLTPEDLLEAARRVFDPSRMSSVIYR